MSRAKYNVVSETRFRDRSRSYSVVDRRETPMQVLPCGRPVYFACAGLNYRTPETRAIQRAIARWRAMWGES